MTRLLRNCTLVLLIMGSSVAAQSSDPHLVGLYAGPHSLGPYNLERDTSMKALLGTLGAKPTGKETYCFEDTQHGIYLYTRSMHDGSGRVAEVLMSSFPNCKGLVVQQIVIDTTIWRTPEGIGIGSTKDEVVHAYGKPAVIGKLDNKGDLGVIAGIHDAGASRTSVGDLSFLYSCLPSERPGCSDDNRATQIGFRGTKLVWIRISNSE